ncbi:hypothetical protein M569_12143 [Genlisea aurea]|uniref:RNase H type-1 domain-containing protein n=1 Tax=Genlisea aurea TaxID=192259 RepID=S8DS55_9LAMI|nr:hypothetical protein M569_12143 [Genlisea aurea]
MKENLAKRRICPDPICDVCGEDSETWFHAFVSCPFSQAVWRLRGIPQFCGAYGDSDLSFGTINLTGSKLNRTICCDFTGSACYLAAPTYFTTEMGDTTSGGNCQAWFSFYYDTELPPELGGALAARKVLDFAAPTYFTTEMREPPAGFMKLNFDSGRCTTNGTGIGGLIRDDKGNCQAWFSFYYDTELPPELGEALAVRKVLEFALAKKLPKVILEGNCLSVIQALADRSSVTFSPLGNVQDSIIFMDLFEECQLRHIRSQFNGAAHFLAKCRVRSYGYSHLSAPSGLGPLLLRDKV